MYQSLANFYDSVKMTDADAIPDLGWKNVGLSYAIVIDTSGTVKSLKDIRMESEKKRVPIKHCMPLTQDKAGDACYPDFLYGRAEYMAGHAEGLKEQKKAVDKYKSMKELHTKLLKDLGDDFSNAIVMYFKNHEAGDISNMDGIEECMKANAVIGFMLEETGEVACYENLILREAWNAYDESVVAKLKKGMCLVTGKKGPLARMTPRVMGLPGGVASGCRMSGTNGKSAFERFGRIKDENFPVSEEVVRKVALAIDYLNEQGDSTVLPGINFRLFSWSEGGNSHMVQFFRKLLFMPKDCDEEQLIKKATQIVEDKGNEIPFYLMALTGNAGRGAISFIHKKPYTQYIRNILDHYKRTEIEKSFETDKRLSPYMILIHIIPKGKDSGIYNVCFNELLDSILYNKQYPEKLIQEALRRTSIEGDNYYRTGLFHGYLSKQELYRMDDLKKSYAYRLGACFSVMEEIQEKAIENINCTIKDRYLSFAMKSPQSVFPKLNQLTEYHLKKLRRMEEKKAQYLYLQRLYTENVATLNGEIPPAKLGTSEQCEFCLGYHDRQNLRYHKKTNNNKGDEK